MGGVFCWMSTSVYDQPKEQNVIFKLKLFSIGTFLFVNNMPF